MSVRQTPHTPLLASQPCRRRATYPWACREGEITPVQISLQETKEEESIVGNARDELHHRHVSPLVARERVLQRVRHWQATGEDAGAVGGGG